MAVNKTGSRRISVDDHVFRWRATGNDGWITLVIWPEETQTVKVIGKMEYYHDWVQHSDGSASSSSQAVITNRIVRAVIDKLGVDHLMQARGQIDIGDLSNYFDMAKAERSGRRTP